MEDNENIENQSDVIVQKLNPILKEGYSQKSSNLCFATTSVWKILFLSVLSCGVYEIIYFFNLWKRLNDNFGYQVRPVARGFFAVITNFWLFGILEKYFKAFDEKAFCGIFIAFLYFLINFTSKLPDYYWLITFGTVLIPVYIQIKINKINKNNFPDAPHNCWSVANTIWTLVLTVFFLLAILGLISES